MNPRKNHSGLIAVLVIATLAGCGGDSAGYRHAAEVADKAADRQAQQNTEMANLNREVADGTKRLVESDAEARKEIVAVHKDLQAERATLNEGFTGLEAERKQIAKDRRTESILLPSAKALGAALVAVAALAFCLMLLTALNKDAGADAELSEMLILDLVREQPVLLPRVSDLSEGGETTPETPRLTKHGPPADTEPNKEGDEA